MLLEMLLDGMVAPEHIAKLAGPLTEGKGLIVIVYVDAGPVQPFKVGVTVMVAVIGDVVLLLAVMPGTFPLPLAESPIAVLELVQVYNAPDGVLLKLEGGMVAPEHTLKLAGTFTTGNGLTVMV